MSTSSIAPNTPKFKAPTVTPAELRAAAMDHAAAGRNIFPCVPLDKTPLTTNGLKDATTDPDQVDAWWMEHARANIGFVPGLSGLIAIDFDPHHMGTPAHELGTRLQHEAHTRKVTTPSGGWQLYYRLPEGVIVGNSKGALPPGIDVRAHAGYVLLPPSVVTYRGKKAADKGVPDGHTGQYVADDAPIAPVPPWLLEMILRGVREGAPSGPANPEKVRKMEALALRVLSFGRIAHHDPEDYGTGRKIRLKECPFAPEDDPHEDDTAAVVFVAADGTLSAMCHHNRCQHRIDEADGRGWALLKRITGFDNPNVTPAMEPPPDDNEPPIRYVPTSNGATPEVNPTPDGGPPEPAYYHNTDLGNAQRLVAHHGADLHYCYPWSTWLTWTGQHWKRDDAGEAVRRAKDAVRSIYAEAAGAQSDERRRELAKWAMRSEARDRIAAMLDLARSERAVPVLPEALDRDPWLLNCQNGTIDLRTGELRAHGRADLLTKLAPVTYDPAAVCPLWESFLWRVMGGNHELIDYLRRTVGYALTGDVSEQVLLFLHGAGSNGKSTFLATLLAMMGKEYGTQAAPELLLDGSRHPTELADLHGKRFVSAIEVEDGRRLAEGLVKQMTGGDQLKARFMRADFFQFDPTFKLFLSANHKPVITGTDYAIWRRIRLIPFTVTIPDTEKDPRLAEKLRSELPGILAWAVRGCLAWQREGLHTPAAVTDATASYRAESDLLGAFLEACTVATEGAQVQAKELYAAYSAWCEASGEKPVNGTRFGRDLTARGLDKYQHPSTRRTFYMGLGLLADTPRE